MALMETVLEGVDGQDDDDDDDDDDDAVASSWATGVAWSMETLVSPLLVVKSKTESIRSPKHAHDKTNKHLKA